MIEYIESQPSLQTPCNRVQKHPNRQQKTPTNAHSRAKLALMRSKSKQNFLTDPQTSDHTQNSTSSTKLKVQILQQKLHKLYKENSELRQQIITMKANQFYTINEEKVKMAIQENEKLRHEICELKKVNEEFQIQNEFLQRNNKNLKQKLQELTQNNVRKSVDISKSRMRQNTARTVNNKEEGKVQVMNGKGKENSDTRNLLKYSSTKYQKRAMQNVKSNPNLMRYCLEEESEFIQRKGQSRRVQLKQSRKGMRGQDPLQISNEHFLKQFEKYQKQLSYNNYSNKNNKDNGNNSKRNTVNTMYSSSRGETDLREQYKQRQLQKIKEINQVQSSSRSKRSRSKQTSLQTILNRKKQLINRKDRHQPDTNNYQCGRYKGENDRYKGQNDRYKGQNDRYKGQNDRYKGQNDRYKGQNDRYKGQNDRYKGQNDRYKGQNDRYRGQNDENNMGVGNYARKQTFNEQYLIGKSSKYPSPNHHFAITHTSPNQKLNSQYANSKRNYRS